jgi:hypothetical protein
MTVSKCDLGLVTARRLGRTKAKQLKRSDQLMDNKIVAVIVSIILPPLAVFVKPGADKNLIINRLLR